MRTRARPSRMASRQSAGVAPARPEPSRDRGREKTRAIHRKELPLFSLRLARRVFQLVANTRPQLTPVTTKSQGRRPSTASAGASHQKAGRGQGRLMNLPDTAWA